MPHWVACMLATTNFGVKSNPLKFSSNHILLGLLLILTSCVEDKKEELTVCFTGDVMLDRGVGQKIKSKGKDYVFSGIKTKLDATDYCFINLECPLTNHEAPIEKQFNFRVNPEDVAVLETIHITHASLANNHSNDQGVEGAEETYYTLRNNRVIPMGYKVGKHDICASYQCKKGSQTITVFAALGMDLPELESQNICSCKRDGLVDKVRNSKQKEPDAYVACYLHWGIEYQDLPSSQQRKIARELIDAGADAIIGHHPHVVQTIEFYKGKPILYSLGNLVFDQHMPKTGKGLLARLTINKEELQVFVSPYRIEECRPVLMDASEKAAFKEHLNSISPGISIEEQGDDWLVQENNKEAQKEELALAFDPLELEDQFFKGRASLEKLKSAEGYRLRVEDFSNGNHDDLHIKHPVYRFDAADVNGDGRTDLLLGVVKTTHFHPEMEKRPQLLQIDSGKIRPLWLGSKLCGYLVDFKSATINGKSVIVTVEKNEKDLFCNGFYHWQDFGLELIEYRNEDSDYKSALNYFNETVF